MKKILFAFGLFVAIGVLAVPFHQAFAASDTSNATECITNNQSSALTHVTNFFNYTCSYTDPSTKATYDGYQSFGNWTITKTAQGGHTTTFSATQSQADATGQPTGPWTVTKQSEGTAAPAPTVGSPAWQQQNCNNNESVLDPKCKGYQSDIGGLPDPNSTAGRTLTTTTARVASCAVATASAITGHYTVGDTLGLIAAFALEPKCVAVLIATAADFIFWIAAFVLLLVSGLFAYTYETLVAGMGSIISDPGSGVQFAWRVIRDLANIGIIGGFIAIAIGTILQIEAYSAKKLLARLIIAALLVNFSYFFAAAIIDSSNYLAVQMYNNIVCTSQTDCSSATLVGKFEDMRVSSNTNWGTLLEQLNPWAGGDAAIQDMVQSVGVLVNILIAIFVFLSAFALLLGRFVTLTFLLISSPFAIAGSAIPGLNSNKFISGWWSTLISQAFFAPIFFLFLGFGLRIAESVGNTFNSPAGSASISSSFAGLFGYFIAAAFLLIALRLAKQMSEAGSEYFGDIYKGAEKLAGWMPKAYVQGLKYAGAVGARNTLGRGGDYVGIRYREWAAKNKDGLVMRTLTATGADRGIQDALGKVKATKFFGRSDFGTEKEARKAREVELGEVEKDEIQKGKLFGKIVGKEAKTDYKNLKKKAEGVDLKAYDELAEKEKKGEELNDRERSRLTELRQKLSQDERDRLKGYKESKEKGGALGIRRSIETEFDKQYNLANQLKGETDKQYKTRQESRNIRNAKGEITKEFGRKDGEDMWAYHERLDAETGFRTARTNAEAIYGSISDGFWEREYDKNPKNIEKLAKILTQDQWLTLVKNQKIRRDVKNNMWKARRGKYATMIKDIQGKVDRGELVEGSKEYKDAIIVPYNWASKNISHDEFAAMITSDATFDDEGTRFEDLRKMAALWNGSLSTSFKNVKDKKVLSETEIRDVSKLKRSSIDAIRDQQAGAYVVLGFNGNKDGDKDYLPYEDGTANYHAAERAVKWAKDRNDKMARIIENHDKGIGNVSEKDYQAAKEDQRYAQMVIQGKAANPIGAKIAAATAGLDPVKDKDKVADARARVIHDARKAYEEKYEAEKARDPNFIDDPVKKARFLSNDENFLMHRLEQTEEDAKGWYEGKNPDEVRAIYNKRNYWSTATAFGMDVDQLQSAAGQDIAERKELFANILMRGDESIIANYASNDNLKQMFSWPEPKRMERINRVRVQQGKPALPLVFNEQQVAMVTGRENRTPPPPSVNPDYGGSNA